MHFRPARNFRPYLIALIVAAALIIPASLFMVIRVEEGSMSPTLSDGQWILVLRGAKCVEPGDLAVFVSPADGRMAVKRCILEEGEQPLVSHGWLVTDWGRWFLTGPQWNWLDTYRQVPEDSVFMVGDNQFHSVDSREYGFISRKDLIGKVLMPPGRRKHG